MGDPPNGHKGFPGAGDPPSSAAVGPEGRAVSRKDAPSGGPKGPESPGEKLDRDMVRWTRAVALLTGCLFLAALLQFGAALLQWGAMQDALRDARVSGYAANWRTDEALNEAADQEGIATRQAVLTEQALRLAQDNANIAKGQLATAQDAENRQLRAYLHVVTKPPLHVAVGEVPQWGIEYGVLGQTPAYDAQVRQLVMLAPYPMPVDITRFYLVKPFQPLNKVAIFPGDHPWAMDSLTCISATGKRITDCTLSPEAMTALTSDPMTRLYVFGLVRYRDAFGAHHQTPYCFSRDPADGTSQICPHLKAPD